MNGSRFTFFVSRLLPLAGLLSLPAWALAQSGGGFWGGGAAQHRVYLPLVMRNYL